MDTPSLDTLKHILDRLKANDIAWFKDKFKAGEFAWLKDRLPEGGYTKLGDRIEAGDLGHVRQVLSGLDLPGAAGLFGGAKAAAGAGAAAAGAAAAKGGAALKSASGVVINDEKKRKGAVWLLPVALLAALALGFGLSRCGKSESDDTTAVASVETTAAAAAETTAAAVETTAPAAETTAAAAAETTAAAAAGGDILDTAAKAGSFNTLGAAISAAGLTDTLKGAGPFTVFAPTDDAFKALPAGVVDALLKPENKDALTKVLTYHVVSGKVMAADLKSGDVATVNGANLTVDVTDGKVKVNDANVTAADVAASNGVIHVIDKVLVPADLDVNALLGAGATETTTVAAAAETTAAVDLTTTNKAGDATPEDLTVYFDSGSAAINAAAKAKIDAAVTTLSSLPAGSKVALVGRADKTGNAAANLALSKRRAEAVQAALVKGLADKASNITFTTDAKGDAEQIEDLTFARRVTIEIAK